MDITLFDLPSRSPLACWSYNPWKTRLILNYKRLSYTTHWIEYTQLASTFSSHGVPPNTQATNSTAEYSCPCIRLANGEYIMDSRAIAHALETLHPEPSLHLDSGYVDRAHDLITNLTKSLAPVLQPLTPELLLNPEGAAYFQATRLKRYGMTLSELAQSPKGGENAWQAAEPAIADLKILLHQHADGPFVLGTTVSYADFILAGFWRYVERLGLLARFLQYDEAFGRQYEACRPWMERDDH